jgi:hypothetical protein
LKILSVNGKQSFFIVVNLLGGVKVVSIQIVLVHPAKPNHAANFSIPINLVELSYFIFAVVQSD